MPAEPSAAPNPVLDAALAYAKRGWPVFPLKPRGKTPATKHGHKDATTNEVSVRLWFETRSDANLGIRTGNDAKFWVLDVDPRHGGDKSLAALEAQHGALPKTPRARTGGGGDHICFRMPERGVRNSAGFAPGLDTRGEGGYVAAAPSVHDSGGVYAWQEGCRPDEVELADAPDWLLALVAKPAKAKKPKSPPKSKPDPKASADDKLRRRAEKYIAKVPPVSEGERNHAAFRISGHLHSLTDDEGSSLPEHVVLALMRRWNLYNTPPLEDDELAACVRNSLENGTPRDVKPPKSPSDSGPPKPPSESKAPPPPAHHSKRPSLVHYKGDLHALTAQALKVLEGKEPAVAYQWAGTLARVVSVPDPQHLCTGGTQPRVHTLNEHALALLMTEHIQFKTMSLNKLTQQWEEIAVDCPMAMVRMTLSRGEWPGIRRLSGIRESLTLLPSGRVITKPGYDIESGYFSVFNPSAFPLPIAEPTKDDAIRAIAELDQVLLAGFRFVTDVDRSAGLASVLTGVSRTAYDIAPGFLGTSPMRSSGKSTLAAIPSLVSTGREPTSLALGDDETESEKRVFALLLEGRPCISLDNLCDDLDSVAVSRAITEITYAGRHLGASRIGEALTTGTLWTGSGINVIPKGDLASRMLTIHLDPKCERPWAQKFENKNPRQLAFEQRGRWVALALTVLRAYMHAGCPDVGIDGYRCQAWSSLVRATLVWLGYADPLAGMREAEVEDPERQLLRQLIGAWNEAIGTEAVTVESLRVRAQASEALSAAILAIGVTRGEYEPRRVGKFLSRHAGVIVDARRIERAGTEGHAIRWVLRTIDAGVSGVSGVAEESTRVDENADAHAHTDAHAHARTHARAHVYEPLQLQTPETQVTPPSSGPPKPPPSTPRGSPPPHPTGPPITPEEHARRMGRSPGRALIDNREVWE